MKNTLKRLIFISLLACMLIALVPNVVCASTVLPVEAFNYTTYGDSTNNEIKITGIKTDWYTANVGSLTTSATFEVIIPNEINGKKVVAIADLAFTKYGSREHGWPEPSRPFFLETVDFSQAKSLSEIGANAFNNHYLLTSISLPDSVTKIGNSSFRDCNLSEITLSKNIVSIGDSAFSGNYKVKYVRVNDGNATAIFELPSNIESIGKSAFYRIFPSGTDEITFKIPASTTKIGENAFYFIDAQTNITITVEGSSYTDFDAKAFNINGTTTSSLKPIAIIFPSKTDYTTYKSKASSYAGSFTYEVDVEFLDASSAPIRSEKKIYNKSIKYVKSSNGLWSLNNAYTLPSTDGFTSEPGYKPNWVYEGTITAVTVNDKITSTADPINIVSGMSLIDPVVKATVNSQAVSTGDRFGGWCEFAVKVPDTYPSTIGVEVTHPLLGKTDSSGGTVIFKYGWLDIEGVFNGSRQNSYPFYRVSEEKDIELRGDFDLRNTYDRYEVVVIGYYVDGITGFPKKFYQSSNSIVSFTGVNNADATDSTIFIFDVQEYTPLDITFNLNNGNVGGDSSNIVWNNVDVATLGAYSSSIPVPVRDGYTLAGWKDNITSAVIKPDEMGSQTVTVSKTYTAQWTKKAYTVTFKGGSNGVLFDGTSNQSQIIEYVDYQDTVTTVPIVKPDKGYTFRGWSMNGGGTYYTSTDVSTMQITANTEFVAHYLGLFIIDVTPTGDNSGSGYPITTDKVSITFNMEMNTSGGYPGTVTLDNGAVLKNGVWSSDKKTITYDLSGLDYSKTYRYTIKDFEAKDGGVILDSVNVYNFITEASAKPQVISVTPSGNNGGSGFPIATDKVSVTFNMEMNASDGYSKTVTLDNGAVLKNGVWSNGNKTITYDLSDLAYSTTYSYTIKNFKSVNEVVMDDSINAYNFITIAQPLITTVTPLGDNSGSGFPISTNEVSVTFNMEMNASVGYPGTVSLDNGAVLKDGDWSGDKKTITYDLSNLAYSTTYSYTIKDFESIDGGIISASVNTYNFKTEAPPKPQIDTVTPEGNNGGTGYPITTNLVTIVFDMEMNTSPGAKGTVTLDNGAVLTGGTWNADKKTINYTVSNLAYSTTYSYSISGFKSVYNIEMDADNSYWFETEPDTIPPNAISATPNGTGILITASSASITFDKKMDPSVIGTVVLDNGAVLNPSSGTWSNDDKTITYTMSNLAYSTTYTFTISGFKDTAGNSMVIPHPEFKFTTEPDKTKPVAISAVPGGINVAIDTDSASISFNKKMNTGLGFPGTVTLNNGAVLSGGTWSGDGKTITYVLSGLDYSTTYTFSIKDFEDIAGNKMVIPHAVFEFTTAVNTVQPIAVSALPSGTNIALSTSSASITFNKEMNKLGPGTVTLDNGAVLNGGIWSPDGKTITYTLSNLAYSTTYTFDIKDFEDTFGNVMVTPHSVFTFTTEANSIAPNVIAVTPNGTGIAINTNSASITFDKEMDTSNTGTVTLDNGAVLNNGIWTGSRTITYDLSGLDYSTTYTYTIADFEDLGGNPMNTPIPDFTFKTVDPENKGDGSDGGGTVIIPEDPENPGQPDSNTDSNTDSNQSDGSGGDNGSAGGYGDSLPQLSFIVLLFMIAVATFIYRRCEEEEDILDETFTGWYRPY